ncbi:toxin-antitoxin system YwqK family antitoxin [Hymenobacter baengnokdamensis]|uniref:toxin-antitoxin system YwqK family antitoxin n=1 Tax=Hymenobacter baengnokdamensis TaxID=2615203 RepID=UPI001243FBB3|nr:hypothetical protein [Hymenobacter baengnokdamensis]
MVKILYSLCLLLPLGSRAQQLAADSIAPDPPALRRVSSSTSQEGECQEVLQCDSLKGVVRVYYASGRLKSYTPFISQQPTRRWGVATSWYESGQLQSREDFINGQPHSLLVYYPNGTLKRQTTYANNQEMLGYCYGPAGQPLPYTPYEQPPLYPGGEVMLKSDLAHQLRLSYMQRELIAASPTAQYVEVYFEVAKDGSVRSPVVSALYPALVTALGGSVRASELLSTQLPVISAALVQAFQQLPRRFLPGQRDGEVAAFACRMSVDLLATGRHMR